MAHLGQSFNPTNVLKLIREFIHERNLTNVMNAKNCLLINGILEDIREFIQERNLVNVKKALLRNTVLEFASQSSHST